MTPAHTLITGLADYAHGLRLADAPPEVRRQAALCILDTVGCMVAGLQDASWRPIAAAEQLRSARGAGARGCPGQLVSVEVALRRRRHVQADAAWLVPGRVGPDGRLVRAARHDRPAQIAGERDRVLRDRGAPQLS